MKTFWRLCPTMPGKMASRPDPMFRITIARSKRIWNGKASRKNCDEIVRSSINRLCDMSLEESSEELRDEWQVSQRAGVHDDSWTRLCVELHGMSWSSIGEELHDDSSVSSWAELYDSSWARQWAESDELLNFVWAKVHDRLWA